MIEDKIKNSGSDFLTKELVDTLKGYFEETLEKEQKEEIKVEKKEKRKKFWKIAGPALFLIAVILLPYFISRSPNINTIDEKEQEFLLKEEQYVRDIDSLLVITAEAEMEYNQELHKSEVKTKSNRVELKEKLSLPIDSARYWNNIRIINQLGKEKWGRD